jgi:hypothetical protein
MKLTLPTRTAFAKVAFTSNLPLLRFASRFNVGSNRHGRQEYVNLIANLFS